MALSTLGLMVVGSIPTVIGVAEAIDAQKKQNQQAKDRIKFHLTAKFSPEEGAPEEQVFAVFKDDKVRDEATRNPPPLNPKPTPYPLL